MKILTNIGLIFWVFSVIWTLVSVGACYLNKLNWTYKKGRISSLISIVSMLIGIMLLILGR